MKIHCLGTTGFHPSPTRHTACYYLPELGIVLDAGTGVFRLIEHLLREPKESLTILLSHAHLDHVVGLTFLVDVMAVTPLAKVKLYGEADKLAVVREHLYQELLFPVPPTMEFCELPGRAGQLAIDGCQLEWFPLEHPGGSIGFCLKANGKKLSYVSDTVARSDADYVPIIRGSDLLMHECYFRDQQPLAERSGHSWLEAVCDVICQAKPKKSALIHINPLAEVLGEQLHIRPEFIQSHDVIVAEDEMCIDF